MRGRSSSSSSKQEKISRMEKHKAEPHLSGAYIRTLVKHLTTSSKTKEPFNGGFTKTLNTNCDSNSFNNIITQKESTPQPPQHKKQVRRRQHTSRPYQERLLNMAEARREIVTALKFHRASMKHQQNNNNNHQVQPPTYYYPISAIAPPPLLSLNQENLDFTLPNQTLGLNLNLNFQDFKNLDANPLSVYSSSSSSSSSPFASVAAKEVVASILEEMPVASSTGGNGLLHHAMDDEEMEEIRSLGEQHQMEWNDTVNLMTSARWFKFLKTMEIGPDEEGKECNTFDQVMEFPSWLIKGNESSTLQEESDDYLQDPALPCMDIGEIEGMYGEWLA